MSKDHPSRYYQSLSRNMILTVIIVSITPMLLVIFLLIYQFNKSYQEKTYAHLNELVQKHKQNIDAFLNEKLAIIRFLAANYTVEQLNNREFLLDQLLTLRKDYGNVFVDLGLISSSGRQMAYAGPYDLSNADYSGAEWFKKATGLNYDISDVFTGLRGTPHFIVSVKVSGMNDFYLVRATVDFESFNYLVQNLRVGKTGFAFILNRAGQFQTNTSVDFKPCQSCYSVFRDAMAITKKNIQVTRWKDESNQEQLFAVASMKDGEWLLVVQQQASDAFSELNRMIYIAVFIFMVGGISIILMAFATSKRMVRRVRRADVEKEKMNEQVIETGKMASLGELAAGIAHEINNPVAIMVEEAGWIGDLLEEEDLKESQNLEEFKRALNQINTQGKRCKEITHKLLSFARKTDSTIKDVHLNELVSELVSLSAQMAKYNKVTIETDLQDDLPFITISPSEMQQVLLNLINNALDAMEKAGGTIKISTKISKLEKDHIVIIVEDNGPGIPEANLPRIFDPFFTTKPVGKGTGLGLAICYGIINKIGGKIDVHSKVNEGTRFRIWIPIQK
ncbi:MAG: ATP-binding protein [Desulfobacterales bacterium]|nr:ATP-binding protein [Desulfobacterales bacterium]